MKPQTSEKRVGTRQVVEQAIDRAKTIYATWLELVADLPNATWSRSTKRTPK